MKKIIVGVAIVFLLFCASPLYNDFRLNAFESQLVSYPLPDETVLIEYQKVCGKLNGNGNGMDFFACVLVKSDKNIEELRDYYSLNYFSPINRSEGHKVTLEVIRLDTAKLVSPLLEHREITFSSVLDFEQNKYFAIAIYDGGYAALFDIRGN